MCCVSGPKVLCSRLPESSVPFSIAFPFSFIPEEGLVTVMHLFPSCLLLVHQIP